MTATLDKTSITTENGKTETITVNLTSVDGYAGDVTLTPTLVDGNGTAVSAVTVDGPATATLTADGTATAMYTVTLPSNTTGTVITGMFKVGVASTAGSEDLMSAFTINNFFTVDYLAGTGTVATDHPMRALNITIARGTVIKFINDDTITHVIHGGGVFPHENTAAGTPGRTYELQTIGIAPGGSGQLGCHDHGTASYSTYTIQ